MPRPRSIWGPALPSVVALHPLAGADPLLASLLGEGITQHVVPKTQSSYFTATAKYTTFCTDRGLSPWPAHSVVVAAWLLFLVASIQPASMQMYLAGLQYYAELGGFKWTLTGDEKVRRTLRFIKRTFPAAGVPPQSKPPSLSKFSVRSSPSYLDGQT
jgi:hypothetical protein